MSFLNVFRSVKEFGVVGTFWKLFQQRTVKFGTLVGVDRFGNKYFENNVDYPFGQNRWIEFAGDPAFYDCDAATIPPEWHAWLHLYAYSPPTDKTVGDTHKHVPAATVMEPHTIYSRNLGGVVSEPSPNFSHARPRGYGIGNGLGIGRGVATTGNETKFYTQPGWPLDPRNTHAVPARRTFSLRDTAATIRTRTASELASFVNDSLGSGAGSASFESSGVKGLEAYDVPKGLELTPEEIAFVNETMGTWSLREVSTRLEEAEDTIAEYEALRMPEATKEGLEALRPLAAEYRRQRDLIRSIDAKYRAAGGRGNVETGLPAF